MPTIHIYPLSRLVHAPAANWEKLLKSIEDGKKRAFSYYLPLREAVVLYCRKQSKGRDRIVSDMLARAKQVGGSRGALVARNNNSAFSSFEAVFYPRIGKYRRDFLRETHSACRFHGVTLVGAPHLEVEDKKGRKRYVVLLPSEWPQDDLKAYLELLAILIEECYGEDSSSLWPMDLRNGVDIKWRTGSRIRRRCESAARLYGRLIDLLEE